MCHIVAVVVRIAVFFCEVLKDFVCLRNDGHIRYADEDGERYPRKGLISYYIKFTSTDNSFQKFIPEGTSWEWIRDKRKPTSYDQRRRRIRLRLTDLKTSTTIRDIETELKKQKVCKTHYKTGNPLKGKCDCKNMDISTLKIITLTSKKDTKKTSRDAYLELHGEHPDKPVSRIDSNELFTVVGPWRGKTPTNQ